MVVPFQVLENTRINGVMQGLIDPRTLPQELVWSQRIPEAPAEDGDIMARFIGQIQIADLVADDQKAAVYAGGKLQFYGVTIPNLKVGAHMTQAMINQLQAIRSNGGLDEGPVNLFRNYENNLVLGLRQGVAWRKETLLVGMLMDSFAYDRLGIKITGANWGMPSDLKITVDPAWTDATNAKPVSNIFAAKLRAQVRYGITYNRITMSTPAFQLMIATDEFKDKARMYLAPNVSFVNLETADLGAMTSLAEAVLKMRVETYDARYLSQNAAGEYTYVPIWDLNAVVLTFTGNDNNRMAWDFANGITTESQVSSILGDNVVPGGPQRGPIAYQTGNPDHNPPQVTYWAVQRGFSRKHVVQASACLRVGTVTDSIAVTVPF